MKEEHQIFFLYVNSTVCEILEVLRMHLIHRYFVNEVYAVYSSDADPDDF
jgi:hypothetical protein